MKAPLPVNEQERLKALHQYGILDTDPEPEFDDITLLASHICGTPIALISLVDENRQWFKSKIGMTENETARDIAFCAHGILQGGVFVVNDARADQRFAANPLVTGNPKIRFYAGAPLVTADGHALGMLCVNDQVPRELTADQSVALQALSRQVVARLELRRSMGQLRETIAQLKKTDDELRWKTAFLGAQVNSSIDGILVVDEHGKKILQNQRLNDLLKIPPQIVNDADDQKQVKWVTDKTKDPKQFVEKVVYLYSHPTEISRDEIEFKDGLILDRYSSPVLGEDGKYYGRIWTFRDITERKRVEGHLFQSQKLETVGKLAGGIAHEFNSIMTTVIGHGELLLRDLPRESPLAKNAAEIKTAASRAATLTHQLLAFGRKQMFQLETLDLNAVLAGMENMLRHLMKRGAELRLDLGAGLKTVRADPGQIEQVVVNMAMNAAEAMPDGGCLTIQTANVSVNAGSLGSFPEPKAGDYVMLAIVDTGVGMRDEVKARVFEPFFSTKGVGKGTGLGLATCHGIIKQSGGHVAVESQPGRGTTFRIYLPQVEQGADLKISVPAKTRVEMPRGKETILMVENDPSLREMASALLGRLGYTVHAAADGTAAMTLLRRSEVEHVDMLFTDVAMPQMSGRELASLVRALHPDARILFTSAYRENGMGYQSVPDEGTLLLQKPFTPSVLAHKVRELLDCDR